MRRRDLIAGLGGLAITSPFAAGAQQPSPKIPRIGILSAADSQDTPIFEAFRRGLRDLGYVEGRNIIVEYKLARGDFGRLRQLAGELVGSKVDIIVAEGGGPTRAAADASRTIPIVMHTVADPVAAGVADTLARPGRNVTGFSLMGAELSAKLIDLMRAAFPASKSVTILVNPSNSGSEAHFRIADQTARSFGLAVSRIEAATPEAARSLQRR